MRNYFKEEYLPEDLVDEEDFSNVDDVCGGCGYQFLDFGDEQRDGDTIYLDYECEKCGFKGTLIYDLVFYANERQ